MTPDQHYADTLLSYWGKWVRSQIIGGYPKECIESRLMREGVLIPTIGKVEESDEVAEKIESIIIKMPKNMQNLVKIEYLTYNTRAIKQKRLRIGRRQYERTLHEAQNIIARDYEDREPIYSMGCGK